MANGKLNANTQIEYTPYEVGEGLDQAWDGVKTISELRQCGEEYDQTQMGPGVQDVLAVTANVPSGTLPGYASPFPSTHVAALAGYSKTNDNGMGAVGVFGCGGAVSDGGTTKASAWGGNFMASSYIGGSGDESLIGVEADVNANVASPYNTAAFFASGGSWYEATNQSSAFWVHKMGDEPQVTVNTSGVNVTRVSGNPFDPAWAGRSIWINGSPFTVDSVIDGDYLTTTATTGTLTAATLRTGTVVPYAACLYSDAGAALYYAVLLPRQMDSAQYPNSESQIFRWYFRASGTDKKQDQYIDTSGRHIISHDATASDPMTRITGGALEIDNRYVRLPRYTFAARPSPIIPAGSMIYVTDGTPGSSPLTGSGSGCIAVSDGTNYRGI